MVLKQLNEGISMFSFAVSFFEMLSQYLPTHLILLVHNSAKKQQNSSK